MMFIPGTLSASNIDMFWFENRLFMKCFELFCFDFVVYVLVFFPGFPEGRNGGEGES